MRYASTSCCGSTQSTLSKPAFNIPCFMEMIEKILNDTPCKIEEIPIHAFVLPDFTLQLQVHSEPVLILNFVYQWEEKV